MDTVGGLALAWRLGVAAVAIAGPTVLYLGLWRFLAWLRDDALVDRLAARGAVETPNPAPADVLAAATEGVGGCRCPDCGTTVVAGATRCRACRLVDGVDAVHADGPGSEPD
ncbi:hypothetical protein DQW50_15355 [Halorubrum sp. 48-1-W]|uniref:hypothetical protein n=1 Tax=Halorubrum sp. 48-1-W TaxID=2249761 RepID=UPI000DCBA195|nr:hypothetical protein [Halorubrum sp. 48-1-W]RAW44216.1 hypothetical protein DQW50_15355 [Halorubrum sp. 48-1-W]